MDSRCRRFPGHAHPAQAGGREGPTFQWRAPKTTPSKATVVNRAGSYRGLRGARLGIRGWDESSDCPCRQGFLTAAPHPSQDQPLSGDRAQLWSVWPEGCLGEGVKDPG